MLGEDPRENRIAEWFRGLTMGVRIQIILFTVVGIVLAAVGSIALIQEAPVLLPAVVPDSKPVPGETPRVAATNVVKDWRTAEAMAGKQKGPDVAAEGKGEVEAMRKLVSMDPNDADSWDRLGKSLFSSGQHAEAIRAFQRALEIKPGVAEVLANLGVTLKTSGEMTEYEKIVQSLALVDPKLARDLMEFSPGKTGTPESSSTPPPTPSSPPQSDSVGQNESGEVGALRKLVAMDPKDADSWDRLGKALFVSGNHNEAVRCFEKSLELKPNVVEVLANLGVAYKTQGRKEAFEEVLAKLTALDPKTGEQLKAFVPASLEKR
ncbi:PIN_EXO1 domain containing protein [Candidatus Methylacidiphilaceae bacterium]